MKTAMTAMLATVLTALAPAAHAALLTYSIVGTLNGQRSGGGDFDTLHLGAGTPITFILTVEDRQLQRRESPFGTTYHATVSNLAVGADAFESLPACPDAARFGCSLLLQDGAAGGDRVVLLGSPAMLPQRSGSPPAFAQVRATVVDALGTLLDGETADAIDPAQWPAAAFRGELALSRGGALWNAKTLVGYDVISVALLDEIALVPPPEPAPAASAPLPVPASGWLAALALALSGLGLARRAQRTGIGVARSTATAVTAFCGEPSMTRSEYVR